MVVNDGRNAFSTGASMGVNGDVAEHGVGTITVQRRG